MIELYFRNQIHSNVQAQLQCLDSSPPESKDVNLQQKIGS